MKTIINLIILLTLASEVYAKKAQMDYPIKPVPFTDVQFTDSFWQPRIETNRVTTIPLALKKTKPAVTYLDAARHKNLKLKNAPKVGPSRFISSDLYKVIEAASYSLQSCRDPKLEKQLDDIIEIIEGAQTTDGYLYIAHILGINDGGMGTGRYDFVLHSHELYNVGHLYEAAVAYFQATGKRKLLDVAIKSAKHINEVFFVGNKNKPPINQAPGHQEIEIGLVKLYRATGNKLFLNMSKKFLDIRGVTFKFDGDGTMNDSYAQQHKPVTEQKEPVGHAVRAVYMYSAMADIAALTGEKSYIKAIDTIWKNIVNKKMSLTGGLGVNSRTESFGDDYDLPNLKVYNETCAAIANMFLNHRMFLLHGDAKYFDVFERVMFNGFLAGVNIKGNKFFYTNPLEADGKYIFNHGKKGRSEWFGCACCPVNIARTMAQLSGYMYACDDNNLFVCLYGQSKAKIQLLETEVEVVQTTDYPWDGKIKVTVNPEISAKFSLNFRIPGWSQNKPVPGNLYTITCEAGASHNVNFILNNKIINPEIKNGFAVINREWKKGDVVLIDIPMPVKKIKSHPKIKYNKNKIAFERGPIIYCAEEIDNKVKTQLIYLPKKTELKPITKKDAFGKVTALTGNAHAFIDGKDKEIKFIAIPYFAWQHRGNDSMCVWLADNKKDAKKVSIAEAKKEALGKVSASYFCPNDPPSSILDEYEPENSRDGHVSRCTFWPHKGTEEWLQINFPKKRKVAIVSVYWFDDTPSGGCKVPESWELEYKEDDKWEKFPVYVTDNYRDFKNQYNVVHAGKDFETDVLRIKIKLQKDFSSGIIKCIIE